MAPSGFGTREKDVALIARQDQLSMTEPGLGDDQPVTGKELDKKRKLAMAVIALSNLFTWSCISLIGPFFPIEAAKKGTNDTLIGLIYSCPEVIIFLMSPIFGKLLSEFNSKFFHIAGLIVFGSCDVMFGWLDKSPIGTPFIVLCFAVRIVEGIGTASILTASYAIAGNNFPDRIGTVYGILQSTTSCGFLLGPAIGGGLYQLGGFGLPFWVLGCCVLVCGVASCVVLPSQKCKRTKEYKGKSSLTLMRSPLVWFGSICHASCALGFTVWEPIFAQHLQQLSQSIIGVIFVVPAITFGTTSWMWGILLDKNVPAIALIVGGLCTSAISLLVLGPAPFFTFLPSVLWLNILSLAFLGLSLAPIGVSGARCIMQGARDLGFNEDDGSSGLVAGIIQSASCIGTFAGPLVGGVLTEHFGFSWTMVAAAAIFLLIIIIFSPFLFITANKHWRQIQKQKSYSKITGEVVKHEVMCPIQIHLENEQ